MDLCLSYFKMRGRTCPGPYHALSSVCSHRPAPIPEEAKASGPEHGQMAVLHIKEPFPEKRGIYNQRNASFTFWKTVYAMVSEYFEIIQNRGKVRRVNVFHSTGGLLLITHSLAFFHAQAGCSSWKKYVVRYSIRPVGLLYLVRLSYPMVPT